MHELKKTSTLDHLHTGKKWELISLLVDPNINEEQGKKLIADMNWLQKQGVKRLHAMLPTMDRAKLKDNLRATPPA